MGPEIHPTVFDQAIYWITYVNTLSFIALVLLGAVFFAVRAVVQGIRHLHSRRES